MAVDARAVADGIEAALRAVASPARAEQEKRYLKSSLVHLGTSVPALRKVALAAARARPDLDRSALLAIVEALWPRGIHECRAAAVELLELNGGLLQARDLAGVVERLIRESRTWPSSTTSPRASRGRSS